MLGSKNLYFADNISVGVRDLGRVIAWYQQKLGRKLTTLKSEDFDALHPEPPDSIQIQVGTGFFSFMIWKEMWWRCATSREGVKKRPHPAESLRWVDGRSPYTLKPIPQGAKPNIC